MPKEQPLSLPKPLQNHTIEVLHCDWGASIGKRWLARARLEKGRTEVFAPSCIHDPCELVILLSELCDIRSKILLGFDFPLGVPKAYADLAGIHKFNALLAKLRSNEWPCFFSLAADADSISLQRPFYPKGSRNVRRVDLVRRLGVQSFDDLLRRCERKQDYRGAACPLFWTLGPNQFGRGAILGWKDVVIPLLHQPPPEAALWPFDGRLTSLLERYAVIIVETYPAEYYHWFFGKWKGKQNVEERKRVGAYLLKWAEIVGLKLNGPLRRAISDGFPDGRDDAFDAVIGLFAMIEVLAGRRPSGEPNEDSVQNVEGWILGLCPGRG